jgi:methylenetetrahydrofolate reductase (NADH)
MRIDDILGQRPEPSFSFEFFPPKDDAGVARLFDALAQLRDLDPAFVSVTWGAGGSTRERTLEIVTRVRRELGLEAMAHFTCVGATTDELHAALRQMRDAGLDNVLALRGDPPQGQDTFVRTEGGLGHASELAALVARDYEFCIVGAAYPEVHPEATDRDSDLLHLKEKVDAGARVLITQLFFHNPDYFAFVDRARALGIDVPIIPGIMPITNVAQIKRFTTMCGARIPAELQEALEACAEEPDAIAQLGVAYATLQCAELLEHGAPGIHFYTLNRSPSTRAILQALRITRPWLRAPQADDAAAAAPA